jgi:two-component system sensor histidine kinase VicK
MLRSIKTKLIVIYAAVILVVMAVSGTFMLLTVRNMEQEHTEMRLRHQADAIYSQIVQQYDRADFGGAAEWGILGQSEYLIESLILSADGLPIAPAQFIQPDLRFNDSAVIAAIGGQEHFSARSIGISLDGVEQQWLTFAKPVVSDGETFIIFVRQNASWMNESLARLTFTLIITVLIALVVTVILWLFLGNVITRPILTLTRHARAIAEGDLNREIEPEGDDEIGQLSLDFRYMATQLGNSLSSMASEKNKLEAFF